MITLCGCFINIHTIKMLRLAWLACLPVLYRKKDLRGERHPVRRRCHSGISVKGHEVLVQLPNRNGAPPLVPTVCPPPGRGGGGDPLNDGLNVRTVWNTTQPAAGTHTRAYLNVASTVRKCHGKEEEEQETISAKTPPARCHGAADCVTGGWRGGRTERGGASTRK